MLRVSKTQACVFTADGSRQLKCFSFSEFGKDDATRRAKAMLGAIEASKAKTQEFKSILIEASVQEMAKEEIEQYVDKVKLEAIKKGDPHPEIKAYVVGHEGYSRGRWVGVGDTVKRWYQGAIKKLFEKIEVGTKLFHLHNNDNSHEGRKSIGEIVGKAVKYIDGKLKAIALAWIKPEYRDQKLDVPSIEGDIKMDRQGDELVVNDISQITGIALGDSAVNKPGFAEAGLLASVQMFESAGTKEKLTMTTEEIKKAIRENGLTIGDIFEGDDLTKDPIIRGIVSEQKGRQAASQIGKGEEQGKEIKKLNDELATLRAENDKLTAAGKKTELQGKLKGIFDSRKLDDKQRKFVEQSYDEFSPDIKDPDKSLNAFIDSKLQSYKQVSQIFGVKDDQQDQGGEKAKSGDESYQVDQNGDIKENPLIP